jgi:hypothetical protein
MELTIGLAFVAGLVPAYMGYMVSYVTIRNQFSIFSYLSTFVMDRNGIIRTHHFCRLTTEKSSSCLATTYVGRSSGSEGRKRK